MKKASAGYSSVVLVVDVDPIPVSDGAPLRFRIEILKGANTYYPRVWRYEVFRQKVVIGAKRRPQECDEVTMVEDVNYRWEKMVGPTARKVLRAVLLLLKRQVFDAGSHTPKRRRTT